jgi:hypothetical protein
VGVAHSAVDDVGEIAGAVEGPVGDRFTQHRLGVVASDLRAAQDPRERRSTVLSG